ncbi:hypothetical protein GCM10029992_54440 [Glycomyces albus]
MSDANEPDEQNRPGVEELLGRLEQTPLGERLSTPAKRQAELYDLLASHPDPLWREMGEQLKSGKMRTMDIFATPPTATTSTKGSSARRNVTTS